MVFMVSRPATILRQEYRRFNRIASMNPAHPHIDVSDDRYFKTGTGVAIGTGTKIILPSTLDNSQGIKFEDEVRIGSNCEFQVWDSQQIIIKKKTSINDGSKILGDVTIERYGLLSCYIFISSGNHQAFKDPAILIKKQDRQHPGNSEKIHIEEDCWIGWGVCIKQFS